MLFLKCLMINLFLSENIIKYILYRDKFIEILDINDVYENIYINEANYERTKILSYFKYKAYII